MVSIWEFQLTFGWTRVRFRTAFACSMTSFSISLKVGSKILYISCLVRYQLDICAMIGLSLTVRTA